MSKKASKPHTHVNTDLKVGEPPEPKELERPPTDAETMPVLKNLFLSFGALDESVTPLVLAELSPAEQHFFLALRAAICTYHELKSAETPAADAPA